MIRQLRVDDAEAYAALRREMLLASPLAFASSPSDDLFSSLEATRERHAKSSHKVHVWGMYVAPDHRRKGMGVDLLNAVLQYARELPGVSCVRRASFS